MYTVLLWIAGIGVTLGAFSGLIYFCRRTMRRPNAATRLPMFSSPQHKRWQRL